MESEGEIPEVEVLESRPVTEAAKRRNEEFKARLEHEPVRNVVKVSEGTWGLLAAARSAHRSPVDGEWTVVDSKSREDPKNTTYRVVKEGGEVSYERSLADMANGKEINDWGDLPAGGPTDKVKKTYPPDHFFNKDELEHMGEHGHLSVPVPPQHAGYVTAVDRIARDIVANESRVDEQGRPEKVDDTEQAERFRFIAAYESCQGDLHQDLRVQNPEPVDLSGVGNMSAKLDRASQVHVISVIAADPEDVVEGEFSEL